MEIEVFRLTPERQVESEVLDLQSAGSELPPPSTPIAFTQVGDSKVSTVFLHWEAGYFETAVFDGEGECEIYGRCDTYLGAVAQHARAVKSVERGSPS